MFLKNKKKCLSVKSIHQCFHLIYFLLYHTGGLGCNLKNEKNLQYDNRYKIYGNMYRLIYLTGLIVGFAFKIFDKELNEAIMGQLSPVIKIILIFECIISPVTYVEVTLYMDLYRDKYLNLANTLQTLDEKMLKHFPIIQWNYQKTKRKYNYMTVGLYGFYVIASTIYIFNIVHCACGFISSTMISFCYACITGAPAFAGFLFIGNMDLLRLRFRLIQKLVHQHILLIHGKSRLVHIKDISKFKLLENYFREYSNLIIPLNKAFAMATVSGLFHDFAVITSLGYLLCSKALDAKAKLHEYVFISLFMGPRIYKVVNTGIYGYATQKEQQNCYREFIKIEYYFQKSALMKQHMEDFFHWRMHNNYRVTVGKILNCNLSLIFLTLNSVANYILILIQLQFQQNNIVNRFTNDIDFISKDG